MTFDKKIDNKFEVEEKVDEKPKKKSKKKRITCKSIIETIYNKEEKTFFSRTLKDWVLLLIFFIFFYVFLFGYFALLLFIFIKGILTPNMPFRTGDNSLLGSTASITYRPVMDNASTTLMLSNSAALTNYKAYTKIYLESVIPTSQPPGIACAANYNQTDYSKPCIFNQTELGPCNDYATELAGGRFCLFLRINNLFGWLPNVINSSASKDILVSCSGVTSDDSTKMGLLAYFPNNGGSYGAFKNYYFPFLNQTVYWSPIVAVQFRNITNNTMVKFTCSAPNVNNISPSPTIQLSLTKP